MALESIVLTRAPLVERRVGEGGARGADGDLDMAERHCARIADHGHRTVGAILHGSQRGGHRLRSGQRAQQQQRLDAQQVAPHQQAHELRHQRDHDAAEEHREADLADRVDEDRARLQPDHGDEIGAT